jgi:hypothetical protein
LTPLDETTLLGTPADVDSIMCYQLPGEITTDGVPIPGGSDLTASDLAFADAIYPKPAGPAPPPSPPPPPPPPVQPPEPGATALKPGVWSPYREIKPPEPLRFRFTVRRAGKVAIDVSGSGPFEVILTGPLGIESVPTMAGHGTKRLSRLVVRLEPGAYLIYVARRDGSAGRARARVSPA